MKQRLSPRRVGVMYLVLFALSIPWYLPRGYGERLLAGFPVWSLISLGCYVAAAALTVATIDVVWRGDAVQQAGSEPRPDAE